MGVSIAALGVLAFSGLAGEARFDPQNGLPAQVRRADGLFTATFAVPAGNIRVFLPDDMAAGDVISGTVVSEPAGATEAERQRNANILEGYVVSTPLSEPSAAGPRRTWRLPDKAVLTGLRILLKGQGEAAPLEAWMRVGPRPASGPDRIALPRIAVSGRPVQISGPFDGDLGTTAVRAGQRSIPVLAESPRQAIIGSRTLSGRTPLECSEGGKSTTGDVQFVTFGLNVADPVIPVGTSTTATIEVGSLQGLEGAPLSCLVVNHDPGVVELEGGDVVPLELAPKSVGTDGTIRKQLRITARGAGTYRLSLRGSVPAQAPSPISPVLPEEPDPETRPEPFGVRLSRLPARISGDRPLRLVAESLNARRPLSAAVFAYRREPNGPWAAIGSDSDPQGGFSVNWNREDLSGGTYTIAVTGSGGDGQSATDQRTIRMDAPSGSSPGAMSFENAEFQAAFRASMASATLVPDSSISYCWDRARSLRDAARGKRDAAAKEDEKAQDEWARADALRRMAANLARLDAEIERILAGAAAEIEKLAKEIEDLKKGIGSDPAAIDAAVQELEEAVADCDEDCEKKKQDIADAEKRIADLEKQLSDLADQVNQLFQADGWTGSARFDQGAGKVRWGFTRDGSAGSKLTDYGSPEAQKLSALRKQKNQMQKDLKKAKEDLEKAKDALAKCEEECAKKKKALEDAKKAKERKDEAAAKEAQVDEKVAELEKKLAELEAYLRKRPELKDLLAKLRDLLGDLPLDAAGWEEFKKKLEEFLAAKEAKEEELKKEADRHEAEGDAADGRAGGLRGEANGLEDEAANEEQRARDLEAERRRQEAAAAEAARKAEEEKRKAEAAARRHCEEEFRKWIQDNIDRGILPKDALEKFENWLKDQAQKIPDLVEAMGKVLEGASSGATGAGLAQGLTSLGAAIFYWWAEAKLRGAVAKLGKMIDEHTKQGIALELSQQRPPKPCGVIQPKRNTAETWFYFRQGNKVLLFKITRDGGLECMGEMKV
jgi:hypothetical protein